MSRTKVNDAKLVNYKQDWNLTNEERENLSYFFLRSWTEFELADRITFDTLSHEPVIRIWNTDFIPMYQGSTVEWQRFCYLAAKGMQEEEIKNNKPVKYWLSFRSGVAEGVIFNYVLIQRDKK